MRPKPDTTRRHRVAISLAVATLAAGWTSPIAWADEAQARDILKNMSDYMAAQPTLSFNFDSSLEIVTTDDQKLAITSSGSVAMQRPDKLHAIREGGFAAVEATFDGTTLSVLNKGANVYAQAELPGSVDALVDRLRDEFHRPLPAADLLSADVGAILLAEVTDVKDLGSGVIDGIECDHLAFRTPEVDWQIWIAQGEAPYPCRYVITTKLMTGWPQYTVDVSDWGKGAAKAEFTFAAPAGAQKVEVSDVPDLDEIAGIYGFKGDK